MKPRKFKPGRLVTSLDEIYRCVGTPVQWLYLFDRPKHPSVLVNMSLVTLMGYIRAQALRIAEPNV